MGEFFLLLTKNNSFQFQYFLLNSKFFVVVFQGEKQLSCLQKGGAREKVSFFVFLTFRLITKKVFAVVFDYVTF